MRSSIFGRKFWGASGLAALVAASLAASCGGDDGGSGSTVGGSGGSVAADGSAGALSGAIILRDEHAVPHVFSERFEDAFFAAGFAEAEDSREDVLRLGLALSGRLAERYGGAANVKQDYETRLWRIPEQARGCVEGGSGVRNGPVKPIVRTICEAYAAGVNHYFQTHPNAVPSYTGDEYDATTPMAILLAGALQDARSALGEVDPLHSGMSNQFAAADSATEGNSGFFLSDGHTPIADASRAVHLSFPHPLDGQPIDVFGRTGGPFVLGNNRVVRGVSNNGPYVAAELLLTIVGTGSPRTYLARNAGGDLIETSMEESEITIAVAGSDPEVRTAHYTRWGPVFVTNNQQGELWTSVAFYGWGDCHIANAAVFATTLPRDLDEVFEQFKQPSFIKPNQVFLDGENNEVAYVHHAYMPQHPEVGVDGQPLDFTKTVDARRLPADWPDSYPLYSVGGAGPDVPWIRDPVGDFVQNSNDHPRYATVPPDQISPDFPTVVTGFAQEGPRGVRIRERFESLRPLSFGDAVEIALDTCAPRARYFIDALNRSIADVGVFKAQLSVGGREIYDVLRTWDGCAETDSVGMTTMAHLIELAGSGAGLTGIKADTTFTSPQLQQLANGFDLLAQRMEQMFAGKADPYRVPWGEVNVYLRDGQAFGMPGGTTDIQAPLMLHGAPEKVNGELTGRFIVSRGSQHLVLVKTEPGTTPEVYVLSPNGQLAESVFPGSPYLTLGAELASQKQLRRLYLGRADVEAHLTSHGLENDPQAPHRAVTHLPRY